MDPGHYWGAPTIAQRMGWKSTKPLHRYIKAYAFPAFKRRDPRNPLRTLWYSNEVLIGRWEVVMAQMERERVLARETELEELRRERARYPMTSWTLAKPSSRSCIPDARFRTSWRVPGQEPEEVPSAPHGCRHKRSSRASSGSRWCPLMGL
jgi:hypothetical protein